MSNVRRVFSRAAREQILKSAVGKPTGVKVHIGGFEFDMVPLTPRQASGIFSLLDAFSKIETVAATPEGEATFTQSNFLALIAAKGGEVIDLAHEIVFTTAQANGLVDESDDGVAVFDEWFHNLDLFTLIRELVPAIISASGLKSLLGNRSTPPSESNEQSQSESGAAAEIASS